jgi:DNA replication initiation complex subunit (GINS family)
LYNELYEIWKKEKENRKEIQKLPKKFFERISNFLRKLKEESRMMDKKTIKAKIMKRELRIIEFMINELVLLRYKKFQKGVLKKELITREMLTKEENLFYGDILSLIDNYHNFKKDILRGKKVLVRKNKKKNGLVLRFLTEIPALIGVDMKIYGPFGPEDIANLPIENAKILINQGIAVELQSN